MNDERRGPPPGPAPPAGAYGPGKTVVTHDDAATQAWARASLPRAPIPPTTIRDAYGVEVPPPPTAPDPPLPAHAPHAASFPASPAAAPLPPPSPRRRGGGPSLLVIGLIATVVIGTAATAIAIGARPASDDAPVPTIAVPKPTTVAADPAGTSEQPASRPPPRYRPGRGSAPRPGWPGGRGPNGPYGPRDDPPPPPAPR